MSVVIKGDSNVNLDFTTGGRITGDFSNATVANRVLFQTSTVNGNTNVAAIPNGTGTVAGFRAVGSSDPTNTSVGQLLQVVGETQLRSDITGTGTYAPMTFYTGGSERVRIDTSGNVGVGVTPSAWASGNRFIDINASASYGAFGSSDSMMLANAYWNGSNWIRKNANNAWRMVMESSSGAPSWTFQYAGNSTAGSTISWSEAMRIDSSGNVGIGTSSPESGGRLTLDRASFNQLFMKVNGTTELRFYADAALSSIASDTNPLLFEVNGAERMRLDSSGNLMVGTTSLINGNTKNNFQYTATNLNGIWSSNLSSSDGAAQYVATTGNTTAVSSGFFFDAGYNWPATFARAFAVRHDGVIFALNTTIQSLSDRRLKENIVDATDGLDIIKSLRPVRFDWKTETGILKTNQLGFIAQEVEAVFPDAVDTYNNSNDPSDPYKSVGAGLLIPVLVKALQELKAMNDTLTARVAQLEAK